jgi:hypothetical protein
MGGAITFLVVGLRKLLMRWNGLLRLVVGIALLLSSILLLVPGVLR